VGDNQNPWEVMTESLAAILECLHKGHEIQEKTLEKLNLCLEELKKIKKV